MHVFFWSIGERSDLVGATIEALLSTFVGVRERMKRTDREKEK